MYDLPAIWQSATRVGVESKCKKNALGAKEKPHAFFFRAGRHEILVVKNAEYRCEQPVEAFLQQSSHGLLVLVQPIVMGGQAVAMCDCLYDIAVPLPSGRYKVRSVLLRGDRYGGSPRVDRIPIMRGI